MPYTTKPDFGESGGDENPPPPPRPRPPRWGTVAALAAAAVLAVSGLTLALKPEWRPWAAAAQQGAQRGTLTLTAADIDGPATAAARAALLRGQIPPSLARVDAETRRRIAAGEQSLYSRRMLDVAGPDVGDPQRPVRVRVNVSINGVIILEDVLTPEHPAVTGIPVGAGTPTRFHYTVESAGPRGTVTCSASSATGTRAQTRPLAAGESAELDVVSR